MDKAHRGLGGLVVHSETKLALGRSSVAWLNNKVVQIDRARHRLDNLLSSTYAARASNVHKARISMSWFKYLGNNV
jgi:hypothetical protein